MVNLPEKIRFQVHLKCPICGEEGLLILVVEEHRTVIEIDHGDKTCRIENPSDELIKEIVAKITKLYTKVIQLLQ